MRSLATLLVFFLKLSVGHFRRHRLEMLLCLAGVALGVAVVVAIDAAVAACVQSFRGAAASLAERSTHSIFSETGPIPDEIYIGLLQKKLPYPLAPVIDRSLLAARGGSSGVAHLLGVDVFSERSLRSFTQMQSSLDADTLRRFLTEPGAVVLTDALALKLNARAGDALQLTIGSRRVEAHVAGIITPTGVARTQLSDVMVADLATAQELTESLGSIDRIDTHLDTPADEEQLAASLPSGLVLRSTRQQTTNFEELIGSYKLNLSALSLMASFVAVFIVYNSMLISVQQRVTSLGILRCLGSSRTQLGMLYLLEALAFAAAGGVIGVLGGWALSRLMVGYIATTINDLYAAVRPGPVPLNAGAFGKGLALSAASCLVGALVPLIRASRTPPVNAFRGSVGARASGRASTWILMLGIALLAASVVVERLPGRSPIAGFAMALLVALGFALCCPALTRLACGAVERIARPFQALPLQMAAAGVARSLGITGVAVASMMLAMAMNVGVRTMVSSFRGALDRWMQQRFAADVFIGPELLVNHKIDATIDPAVERWVRLQPEVRRLVTWRGATIQYAGKPTLLVGTDVADLLSDADGGKSLPIQSRLPRGFEPARDALVSEPLAGRARLRLGSTVQLDSPAGTKMFTIYGVFYDFGSERGQVMLDRRTYAAGWRDETVSSLHVRLQPGNDPEQVADRWERALRPDYPIVAHSFAHVETEVMTVFDRTFKVTRVLSWLAGGVAFCGLAGSLLALALARQRDYSVLAAVGMSARQTAVWVLGQGLLIAWTAAAVAAVAGTALAYVLAYVIQYRSFGWSIPTSPQPRFWGEIWLLSTAAALLAVIYPARRLRSTPPAISLRQE